MRNSDAKQNLNTKTLRKKAFKEGSECFILSSVFQTGSAVVKSHKCEGARNTPLVFSNYVYNICR